MKQTESAATLAADFRGVSVPTPGYEAFFEGLMQIVEAQPVDDALGARIRKYVLGWLSVHPLTAFGDYSPVSYRRTYVGRCPRTGWEAIVMSWQRGNRTSVHAHPQFAGYHFADGRFLLEIFEPAEGDTVHLKERVEVEGPAAFFAVGEPGRFDNHIHRITCLSDTGHSLHVYSDDALRGRVYRTE